MAQTISANGLYGLYYFIDSDRSRDVLTSVQMNRNVDYFYSVCVDRYPDWTANAIAAMLGNIRYEGVLNPSQWQYGLGKSENGGYGLCQWTPATKLLNWLPTVSGNRYDIAYQVERIKYEADNGGQWIQTSAYPISFNSFLASTQSAEYLAEVWLYNYERPADPAATVALRRRQAGIYLDYLGGVSPTPPDPDPPSPAPHPVGDGKRMRLWMYPQFRKR